MVQHREVSIAVCGAIVGVMIGAISFLTIGGSNLVAKMTLGEPVTRDPAIVSKILRQRNRVTDTRDSAPERRIVPVSEPVSVCGKIQGLVSDVRAKARETFPTGSELSAFEDFLTVKETLYCQSEAAGTHAAAPETSTKAVDNNCASRFSQTGARYTTCKGYERAGREY